MRRGRRVLAAFFAFFLCLFIGMTAVAEEETDWLTPEEKEAQKKAEKELKRLYKLPIQTNELTGWPEGPGTYGEAAIVMEVGSGAVLYAKNIDGHYYPASITKVLTTLTALENGNLDDKVTFSEDSLSFLEPGDAYIGMEPGNVITLEQALYAVLLASANEVSYAVSESVGKNAGHNYSWFIEKMNEKCQELGGENSHFVNANGLHDDEHYTCARDMALIGRELYKYPEVFKIMQTLQYKIKKSKTTKEHVFQQNHKMFYEDNPNYWEYVIGGKTGYTDQAHNTLVTMVDNGDMQLVCVVLKTEGVNVYSDTRALCDYVYDNFEKVDIAGSETSEDIEEIISQEEKSDYVVLPKGMSFDKLDMEITPDEEVKSEAVLTYTYGGNYVGEARARLSKAYMKKGEVKIISKAGGEERKSPKSKKDEKWNKKMTLAIMTVVLLFLIFAFVKCMLAVKRANKKRKKRERKLSGYRG